MNEYKTKLDFFKTATNNLSSTINNSNSSIIAALGDYESVDVSQLDDIAMYRNQLMESITKLDKSALPGANIKNSLYENAIFELDKAIEVIKNVSSEANKATSSIENQNTLVKASVERL